MQCTGCGKSLSTEELRGENCPYCETALPHRSEAIANAASIKELLRDANQDGVPDVLEGTHLDPRNQPKKVEISEEDLAFLRSKESATSSSNAWVVVFVLILVAGAIGAVFFMEETKEAEQSVRSTESKTNSSSTSPAKHKPARIYVRDVCLLDANGDSAADILASTGSGEAPVIRILNGTNGQTLWASKPYDTRVDIACIDEHWFVVAQQTFQLDFYNSRQLGPPIRVMASDRLRAIQMGDGCVAFKTADRKKAGVALPSGMTQKCATSGRMPRLSDSVPGIMALTEHRTQAKADGTIYKLSHRKNGTPMLIVTATKDKKTLWKKELSVRKPTFAAAIAVGDGVVAVVGSVVPHRDRAVLVGLKAEDGSPLYEVALGKSQADNMDFMYYNGEAIVMQHGVVLEGRNIETGHSVWRIGD